MEYVFQVRLSSSKIAGPSVLHCVGVKAMRRAWERDGRCSRSALGIELGGDVCFVREESVGREIDVSRARVYV